ncbi:MAG TPA: YncE family protein [Bryobacteraceae bacterium]|jgi:DNA-binding beta-propeller fold protein YncE|nr:YncE family protein [Bryobacteraceae bacterium]
MYRCLAALLVLSAAFAQSNYHQLKKISIGGEGGWDYLIADAASGRVYVSHGTEVDVVDIKTGAVAGKITGLHGVHGIALAPEFGRGFISNGQSGTITIFDLKSLDKIGEDVPAGKNPDAIIYDPGSKRVFAFNGRSSDATAIDAKDGKVAGTVALEGKPEFAAADGKGHVYVNIEDKNEVFDIDAKKLTVEHRWSLAPCEEPSGMAMDTKSRRIFSGCHNKMVAVMNADSGKVVATPAIGDGVDATAFDPETKYVFNSCGDGTLSIAHEDAPDKYTVVEQVKTIQRARTMALDSKTHNVYLAIADFEPAPAPATPPAGDKGSDKAPQRPRMRVVPDTFSLLEYGR